MKAKSSFDKVYKKLNNEQKDAVNSISGPVLVIAGPGTGKTQILTLRIANIILKTDTEPNSILALTFTESGVKAMRERLASFIGKTAYYVNITTFHSFALDVLQNNPEYFLITRNSKVASDLEKLTIVQNILEKNPNSFEYLRPQGDIYYYSNYIIKCIQDLKREGITYKKYKEIIKDNKEIIKKLKNETKKITYKNQNIIRDLTKQLELKKIYKGYQQSLKKQNLYDFEDLINRVNNKFQKEETLLREYQEKYQYVLVDEFQDTNNSQYNILKNLTSFWGENADIFAVGDDEQSIYRFQGASMQNILNFTYDFPKAKIITLKQNYRSTQLILDSSRELIRNNKQSIEKYVGGIEKNLNSNIEFSESKIRYYNFSNGITESYFITTKIKELLEKGENPEDIAVLYRYNSDSIDIANILSKLGIMYNLEGGENILADSLIIKLVNLFKVILNSLKNQENLDLFTVLSYKFLGFDYVDNLKIARKAANKKIQIYDYILSNEFIEEKIVEKPEKYTEFLLEKIPSWQQFDQENTFTKTFENIIEESGYLTYLLKQKNSAENINKINSLYNEIKNWASSNKEFKLKNFLANIEILNANNLKITETDFDIISNSVTLCTVHKSKGLEFKYVFIYGFTDKKWGNNTVRELIKLPEGILISEVGGKKQEVMDNKEKNEEERRLFYVAITRAKQNVYITSANKYSTAWGEKETEKSMFYYELPQKNIQNIDIKKIENKSFIKKALEHTFVPTTNTNISKKEENLLKGLINSYKLSVTGLNTYLECPYKFKLNTLIKTPRSKAPYLSFGTAVHYALESMYRKFKEDSKLPKFDFLYNSYRFSLNKEILTKQENIVYQKKGQLVLKAYYEKYKDQFVKPEYLERLFGYGFSKVLVEDMELTGKVDRIELLKNESGIMYVKVIDYKTGKPKSRNEILGKTKNSDGAYKRQLVFYKILCDLDRSFKYKAKSFELDFVGDSKGVKPKKEVFEISEGEIKELKNIIVDTLHKIRNMEFNRTTDYNICNKCDYKNHCWPEGVPRLTFKQNNLEF
ncbi:hypothetical protein COV24_00945 [candidate division WWE3 bacterium CG10_big_fil_rev_8_21_14_0_10_32_10]|uniref:DNA 3'-5' helicase n=1 Tax=candidate division WWE3 bacterium CG10_big_fil_rev_8_21_14_0_10_32_10 TaxID=1975090 RepID=A0A2H0RB79_UNCKA|nr:MAG: hypothetical protein COV24_00945 [candidate division WWE3 bacterium CG10_big_fil_rev_8_21_14_0_10_32_10]